MVNQAEAVNVGEGPLHGLVDRLSHFASTAMELAMLQGELAVDDARRARKRATYAAFMVVAAGALMISSLPILGGAFVAVLVLFANWPVWIAAFAVSVAFLTLAGLLLCVAWTKIKGAASAFDATRHEASANLNWLRQSLTKSRTNGKNGMAGYRRV